MSAFSNADMAWPRCRWPLGDGAKRKTGCMIPIYQRQHFAHSRKQASSQAGQPISPLPQEQAA
jgi:hypothetical protein